MIPIALIITASLPFLYVSFLEILFWPIAVIPAEAGYEGGSGCDD
jgi:hypothetical protein